MKKPDPKKPYSNFKSNGSRNNFERAPRSERATLRKPYENKRPLAAKVPYEKPVYRGKEARLAGSSRTETRVYSGYAARTPRTYSAPRPAQSPRMSSLPMVESKKLSAISSKLPATPDTSWGGVADWYNNHLEKGDDTYHTKVIFPNVLRMMGDLAGKRVLDLACGQGIFSQQLRDKGALVTGVDIGKELIAIAEAHNEGVKEKGTHKVSFFTGASDDLYMVKDETFDSVVCILALQNIEDLQKTLSEVTRVLVPGGKFIFVLNHPSFRNPRQTSWGYNEADNVQYRRVDEYMSESHVRIDMTPGNPTDKKFTVSFHRPLQVYVKALTKHSFAIARLEEWVSHRESEKGPRQKAENKVRKEIPLFMCIEAQKAESRK